MKILEIQVGHMTSERWDPIRYLKTHPKCWMAMSATQINIERSMKLEQAVLLLISTAQELVKLQKNIGKEASNQAIKPRGEVSQPRYSTKLKCLKETNYKVMQP